MILPLEKQVCSLELAKKLKELGVPQQSIFYWNVYSETAYAIKFLPYSLTDRDIIYSAYTSAELACMFPKYYVIFYQSANESAKTLIHLLSTKQITLENIKKSIEANHANQA